MPSSNQTRLPLSPGQLRKPPPAHAILLSIAAGPRWSARSTRGPGIHQTRPLRAGLLAGLSTRAAYPLIWEPASGDTGSRDVGTERRELQHPSGGSTDVMLGRGKTGK
jgi:hypothetical protein